MEIIHKEQAEGSRFEIKEKDVIMGEMVYRLTADKALVIEHTFIDPSLRGKNLGFQLLEAVANFARKHQLTLKSECSYASTILEKNKETFKDII